MTEKDICEVGRIQVRIAKQENLKAASSRVVSKTERESHMYYLEQACNWNVTTPFFSLEVTSVHLQNMHSNPLHPPRTSSLRAAPEITTRGSIDLVSQTPIGDIRQILVWGYRGRSQS